MPRSPIRQALETARLALRGRPLFVLGFLLAVVTVGLGLYGWKEAKVESWGDRVYLTLLAFTGDPIYVPALSKDATPHPITLTIARFTGFATILLTVIGLLSLALAERLSRWWAGRRADHAVLIGATPFGLDRLAREAPGLPLTVIGPAEIEPAPGTLHFPIDPDDTDAVRRVVGQPAKILFGDRDPLHNIARARSLLPGLKQADALVRVEDLSLVRDLGLLAPELKRAEPVSSSEAVAEALVFALSVSELAELRWQPGVHVVMIGLGTTGLAIAEQLAATCQRPDGGPRAERLRLTVLDVDAAAADARIDGQSPGLRAVTTLDVHGMDGEACRSRVCLERLRQIETTQPIAAVIVVTGDDARNAAIGMRLRQVQRERLLFKAPILVRNRMAPGRAPASIDDISGGVYAFGGDRAGSQDPDLVAFEEELGKAIHTNWVKRMERSSEGQHRLEAPKQWDDLTSVEKRSSLLAARAAPHFLRAAGLVPDLGTPEADMRVHVDAVQHLSEQQLSLAKLEHERWIAEKTLDGWEARTDRHSGAHLRDDERKIHTAFVEWDGLSEDDRDKDIDNIKAMTRICADRWQLGGPAWRHRIRVGVMGPLDPGEDAARLIEETFERYLSGWPGDVPLRAMALEILTPDAPGFDRIAPVALLSAWNRVAGAEAASACRVIALRAAGSSCLDTRAKAYLAGRLDGADTAAAVIAEQTAALQRACRPDEGRSILRTADLRPPDISDADLARDDRLWEASLAQTETRIDLLSDLLVWGRWADGRGRSARIAARRANRARRSVPVDLSG